MVRKKGGGVESGGSGSEVGSGSGRARGRGGADPVKEPPDQARQTPMEPTRRPVTKTAEAEREAEEISLMVALDCGAIKTMFGEESKSKGVLEGLFGVRLEIPPVGNLVTVVGSGEKAAEAKVMECVKELKRLERAAVTRSQRLGPNADASAEAGPETGTAGAEAAVQEMPSWRDDIVQSSFPLHRSLHHQVLGGGVDDASCRPPQVRRRHEERFKVSLNVRPELPDQLFILGPAENVEECEKWLRKLLLKLPVRKSPILSTNQSSLSVGKGKKGGLAEGGPGLAGPAPLLGKKTGPAAEGLLEVSHASGPGLIGQEADGRTVVGVGGKYGYGGSHTGWGRGAGPDGSFVPYKNRPRPVFLADPSYKSQGRGSSVKGPQNEKLPGASPHPPLVQRSEVGPVGSPKPLCQPLAMAAPQLCEAPRAKRGEAPLRAAIGGCGQVAKGRPRGAPQSRFAPEKSEVGPRLQSRPPSPLPPKSFLAVDEEMELILDELDKATSVSTYYGQPRQRQRVFTASGVGQQAPQSLAGPPSDVEQQSHGQQGQGAFRHDGFHRAFRGPTREWDDGCGSAGGQGGPEGWTQAQRMARGRFTRTWTSRRGEGGRAAGGAVGGMGRGWVGVGAGAGGQGRGPGLGGRQGDWSARPTEAELREGREGRGSGPSSGEASRHSSPDPIASRVRRATSVAAFAYSPHPR